MQPPLIRFIEKLMPKNPEMSRNWSSDDQVHAMTFVFLAAVATGICFLFTLGALLLTLTHTGNFLSTTIAGAISLGISASILLFFMKTGRLTMSTSVFSTAYLLVCLLCVGISGGSESLLLPLLICSPIIATVTGGREEGLYYMFMVLIFGYLLIFLDSMGLDFLQIMPAENHNIQSAAIWTITLVLNGACLFVYQYFYEDVARNRK